MPGLQSSPGPNVDSKREEQPPGYTARKEPNGPAAVTAATSSAVLTTEHSFSLKNTKGQEWLTLVVSSRAGSAKSLPVFFDEDEIRGTVKFNAEKPESSKGVTISIRAESTVVGQEPLTFVDQTIPLWTPSTTATKLCGSLSWPFSMTLPKETSVSVSKKEQPKTYPLPPTFSERASPAYIDYKIIVTVKRGFLKVANTLSTSFAFVPRVVAPPPSILRAIAYNETTQLAGPDCDPEGWVVLKPIKINGTLFSSKTVELEATLALGNPLSYAAGSPIPLSLKISSSDEQALDLLSKESSVIVFLTRTISIGSTATDETAPRRSNNTFPEPIGKAFWWPDTEGVAQEGVRQLLGEIDVRKTLKPGFVFPKLTIRYHIALMPFTAPGFAPLGDVPSTEPLLSEKIEIATENSPGVFPHSHAPPGYVKPEEGNYNNAMGYLENGNQRFYHHHGFG